MTHCSPSLSVDFLEALSVWLPTTRILYFAQLKQKTEGHEDGFSILSEQFTLRIYLLQSLS